MAVFPLFVDLKGKRCVVVGGGKVATRKVETLLRFGTRVVVISPEVSPRIEELKYADNNLVVIRKKYSSEDIEDAFLVIAATSDSKVNERIYLDAVGCSIFVNVIDDPQKCTFVFPSVVMRSDLVVGISTSGLYPAMSKKIRKRIEGSIPESYGSMLNILKDWRVRAEKEISSQEKRSEFLNKALDEVIFFEDAITEERMMSIIENIFREYRDG